MLIKCGKSLLIGARVQKPKVAKRDIIALLTLSGEAGITGKELMPELIDLFVSKLSRNRDDMVNLVKFKGFLGI